MKRKFIVTTTVCSIVLAITMFCVGVYAAINQTFSIKNTIGFQPSSDINVSIYSQVTNCEQSEITEPPSGYATLDEYFYDRGIKYKHEHNQIPSENIEILPWTIWDTLNFISYNEPIYYEIEIWNYSDCDIEISLENYLRNNNLFQNSVIGDSLMTLKAFDINLGAEHKTLKLKTEIISRNQFVGTSNDFSVLLKSI